METFFTFGTLKISIINMIYGNSGMQNCGGDVVKLHTFTKGG